MNSTPNNEIVSQRLDFITILFIKSFKLAKGIRRKGTLLITNVTSLYMSSRIATSPNPFSVSDSNQSRSILCVG